MAMLYLRNKPIGAISSVTSNEIKSGLANYTVGAGGATSISVVFDNPYPTGTSYAVVVSQSGTYAYNDIFIGSTNRTVNGFTIAVSSGRNAELSSQVMWIAVPIKS